jgi:light-regulated signal transduction histidine kinase (bacteriophytochrome)
VRMAENEIKALNESLEKKVEERTSELKEANKELEAFSYSVSHDMRNPLQIINGYASILMAKYKENLNTDAKDLLQKIKTSTKQMGQLIEDLLNFSRSGRQTLTITEVDMAGLVKGIVKDMEHVFTNSNVKVTIHNINNAWCDPNLIKQVWINLISNAIKYSGKKKQPLVEINSSGLNGETVFYVKDNGAGFSMEHANELFGVFKRLHEQTEFEGSGVGLAIVHRIISKHGGRIWAKAKEGEGATFYFTLPNSPKHFEASQVDSVK